MVRRLAFLALALAAPVPYTLAQTAPAPAPATFPAPTAASLIDAFLADRYDELEVNLPLLKDTTVPLDQRENIAYIRQVYAETHPIWWKPVKRGQTTDMPVRVWSRPFVVKYDVLQKENNSSVSWNNLSNNFIFSTNWPSKEMDSEEEGDHGFTKGQIRNFEIWHSFGKLDALNLVGKQNYLAITTEAAKIELERFLQFRGYLTGAVYALPNPRRRVLLAACDAPKPANAALVDVHSRRALASMLIIEVLSRPDKYPTLKLSRDMVDASEDTIAFIFRDILLKTRLTLAEDRLLRDMFKTAAAGNELAVAKSGKVTLPQGLSIALDSDKDKPLREKRDAWIKAAVLKLPK